MTLGILLALCIAAPTVDEVIPSPLPVAAIGELAGAGFDATTRVVIGEVTQRVIAVEATRLRFIVADETPLGAQTLVVTTGAEATSVAVEVVAPAPTIDVVEPRPLVLGGLATVVGEGLASVTHATLDGVACELGEQTDAVLVLVVPFAAELVGTATLVLSSPAGDVHEDVVVVAPPPSIDAISPNPVNAGGLITVRGTIAALAGAALTLEIAAVPVPIVLVRDGASGRELVAWVPRSLAPRSYDVVVVNGAVRSAPAGPLVVLAAASDAPEVSAAYPAKVAIGGDVWVVGAELEQIDEVSGGLELVACERRACRVATAGLTPGASRHFAVSGPSGAGTFELEASDEAPVVPSIARVEPSPATRGRTLTIHGEDLAGVRSVVIGGVAQSIAFVDVDRVEVTVDDATPLGAETLFVVGNAGSLPSTVTVLDPLPEVERGDASAEDAPRIESGEVDEPAVTRADDGCQGGAPAVASGLALWSGVLMLSILAQRRRSR